MQRRGFLQDTGFSRLDKTDFTERASGALNRDGRSAAADELDGVAEDLQARADQFRSAGPLRVLGAIDEAFGVRHEAEDDAGFVADAGDVVGAAVGIVGKFAAGRRAVRFSVGEDNLISIPEGAAHVVVGRDEFSFAVGDGGFELFDAFRPDATGAFGGQVNPAVDKPAAVIIGEGTVLAVQSGQRARQKFGLNQHLETITDADHRPAGFDEPFERVRQMMRDLIGQDSPGGDVVAVTKAPGNRQNLMPAQQARIFHQAVDVHALGGSAGELKGMGGFAVAIGPGGSQNHHAGFHAVTLACNARQEKLDFKRARAELPDSVADISGGLAERYRSRPPPRRRFVIGRELPAVRRRAIDRAGVLRRQASRPATEAGQCR
jgi:hypothetical protein